MGNSILVALVVAIVGSGSLAVLVGKIFGRIIDKMLTFFGNHMASVKTSVDDLAKSIAEHDKHEGERHERWLDMENNRVTTCNETAKMLIDLGKGR